MAHHWHAGINYVPHDLDMPAHTFKLHGMSSNAHQLMHRIHRFFESFPIREKRQVSDDKFRRRTSHSRPRCVTPSSQSWQRGWSVSVHCHGQTVADEDAVNIRICNSSGARIVIASDHGDPAPLVFHLLKVLNIHNSLCFGFL
jgi:hypothetical protein